MSIDPACAFPKDSLHPEGREWCSGFLLLGILLGLFGSIAIAWQYHIDVDPRLIGLHFLALNAGYVIAAAGAQYAVVRVSLRTLAVFACVVGLAALLGLSFVAPPAAIGWRMMGLGLVGLSAGTLATALLYGLEPFFVRAPAATANRAGTLFVAGSLVATAMVGMTYFAGSIRIETALLAVVPLVFAITYAATRYPASLASPATRQRDPAHERSPLRDTLKDLRSVAAVLLSVLLFFQFGNEWAIAGWLPLFLIHRMGVNPVWAISALGLYFLTLMLGRLIARRLLVKVRHGKLLVAGAFAAVAGFLLLSFTGTFAAACIAVVVIGAGFAPIYPVIAETLDERFSYHPGFYNGIFSLAITGAMCTPWLLGYVEGSLGVQWIMLLPAAGSIVSLCAALLLMLEAKVMSGSHSQRAKQALRAASGQ